MPRWDPIRHFRGVRACLVLAALVALSGCAAKPDLGKASNVVETALDSWKKGEDPRQLASRGIEITDPDWSGGNRLLEYTVKSTTAQPQQGPRVVVVLKMQDRAGKTVQSEVAYEVLLNDGIKIGRDAFHVGS